MRKEFCVAGHGRIVDGAINALKQPTVAQLRRQRCGVCGSVRGRCAADQPEHSIFGCTEESIAGRGDDCIVWGFRQQCEEVAVDAPCTIPLVCGERREDDDAGKPDELRANELARSHAERRLEGYRDGECRRT